MKYLNRAKVVVVATTLIHHVETMMVEVELVRDGSAVKDGSSIKALIADNASLLKTELILGSHGMSNSSVMRASLLRTLGELVRQACDFLTILG